VNTIRDVLGGDARWGAEAADAYGLLRGLPEDGVDLVFGSPPYPDKGGRYKDGTDARVWKTDSWVESMYRITTEAVRVSRGDVVWVVNGSVRNGEYLPAVEGLLWKWYSEGRRLERPVIWHKNAAPNRHNWFSNDWEFVVCFPAGTRKWNWEAIATPPRYEKGGRFRQRNSKGERKLGGEYPRNDLTKPRDVLRVTVGGGHLGHKLAHEGEAPFPVKLVVPFVLALTDPGGIVFDPFLGSGSTFQAALAHGRRAAGCDERQSQIELTARRMASLGY
jgi:adenine-specific DNA-methyltransferase